MNKKQKLTIIEKFKNSLQKVGYVLQQIVFDEENKNILNISNNLKQREILLTQSALRQQQVVRTLPEEVRDEVSSRVTSEIIEGYSPLIDFVTNESAQQNDIQPVSASLKQTKKAILEIPDQVENMFKDKKLDFKILNACVGLEVVKQNEQNYVATTQLATQLNENLGSNLKQKANKI